jgi:hypothetical protein
LQDGLANLQWIGNNEDPDTKYIIERSDNQSVFTTVGTVDGQAVAGASAVYHFTDPKMVTGPTGYRIKITSNGLINYSKVVLLSNFRLDFSINSLVNPFTDKITFEMVSPVNGMASFIVVDAYGRVVKKQEQAVAKGLNSILIPDLSSLSSGMYALRVQCGDYQICKPVLKIGMR